MIGYEKKISTNRWILHFMALAFFWLVMGELIILHQKAIYGFDPFEQESPFAKTDNTSKTSKTDKGSKIDKYKDQIDLVALIKNEQTLISGYRLTGFIFTNTYSILISQSGYPLIVLRGPPSA